MATAACSSSSLLFFLPSISPSSSSSSSRTKALAPLSPLFSSSSPFLSLSATSSSPLKSFALQGKPRLVLVPNVALSSGLDQQEEEDSGTETEDASFSPDLKLFVGNLPFSVDSAKLAGLFGRAGNVEVVEVIYDKLTGRSRGFGFVTMSTMEEVETAAQQFNGYELDGRPLRVNSGPPPRRDEFPSKGSHTGSGFGAPNRVYVGNLSWGVDNLALETLFSEQGKVLEAKVVYDRESGRSRGFGFVTFSSAEEVSSAISTLNGIDFDGREIRVTVAEARPKRQF